MTRVTQISTEEMAPVIAARAKALEVAGVAERALKDARVAELEFQVQIQQLYLAKGLDPNCRLDSTTGNVAWPDETQQKTEISVPEKQKRGKKTDVVVKDPETQE